MNETIHRMPTRGGSLANTLAGVLGHKPHPITVTSRDELKQLIMEQTGDFIISIPLGTEEHDGR